jgi:hypothetical protein
MKENNYDILFTEKTAQTAYAKGYSLDKEQPVIQIV